MGRPHTRRTLTAAIPWCLILLLALPAAPLAADTLSVLSQNMNRLFDDIDDGNNEKVLSPARFRKRIETAARRFGDVHGLPHIIALQEVENRNVLRRIADEIERRYRVSYRSLLMPGNDLSGINLGYLVRAEIEVGRLELLFADAYLEPGNGPLFSRPPFYLHACLRENCLVLLNLHLRSMRGIDDDAGGERVRRKRLRQAEAVAAWSNRLQHDRPRISLLLLGDFNALTPADEFVDVAGIIRGNPTPATRLHGRDLVDPDLIDLTRLIPAQRRYSFVFRGKRQQLDYMFVNQAFAARVEYIGFGDIERKFSDHAGLLARFRW